MIWLGLRTLVNTPSLPVSDRLGLILGTAVLCLLLGWAGLRIALHRKPVLPLAGVLALASLPPMLAFALPHWVPLNNPQPPGAVETWLAPGQPQLYLWQALVLGGFVFLNRKTWMAQPPFRLKPALLAVGALAGLGLGLLNAFTAGLLAGWLPPANPALPPWLEITTLVAAVLISPIVSRFFYQRALQPTLPERIAPLLAALVFASLQFRPLAWLPAFFLSLAMNALARRSGRLYPAILAQAIFNLVVFSLGWMWVV